MHSIVTTFREAVIKVEVANFGAANRHLDRSRWVCSSLTIYALMNAESRYYPQSSFYEDSTYFFPHIDWYFSKKLEKRPIKSLIIKIWQPLLLHSIGVEAYRLSGVFLLRYID